MARVINPFSVRLNKRYGSNRYSEIVELEGKPVYRNGDITIWKEQPKSYATCWKNIIVTQTVGAPRVLADLLSENNQEIEDRVINMRLSRMREAIEEGKAYARENNLDITNI